MGPYSYPVNTLCFPCPLTVPDEYFTTSLTCNTSLLLLTLSLLFHLENWWNQKRIFPHYYLSLPAFICSCILCLSINWAVPELMEGQPFYIFPCSRTPFQQFSLLHLLFCPPPHLLSCFPKHINMLLFLLPATHTKLLIWSALSLATVYHFRAPLHCYSRIQELSV